MVGGGGFMDSGWWVTNGGCVVGERLPFAVVLLRARIEPEGSMAQSWLQEDVLLSVHTLSWLAWCLGAWAFSPGGVISRRGFWSLKTEENK